LAGDVDVAVDQARKHEGIAQIDDLAIAVDEAIEDFAHLTVGDHESFIAQHGTVRRIGQKSPDLNERRSFGSRLALYGYGLEGIGRGGQAESGNSRSEH